MFFSLRCDWHLCKTEDMETQPAGVFTVIGITFFVLSVYHTLWSFTRREFIQITSRYMVQNGESITFTEIELTQNDRCDMIIVLGHLCGDGPFLFSRIGVEDAGIKKELPKQSIVPKCRADHRDRLSWPNGLICPPCLRTNWV